MMGKTHSVGGIVSVLGGYLVLKTNGYLVNDVSPILQLAVMYPFAIWSSTAPDLDHHADSSPAKDPVSKLINRGLHIFNKPTEVIDNTMGIFTSKKTFPQKLVTSLACKHRSWQTHSEVPILLMYLLLAKVLTLPLSIENTILTLIVMGIALGFMSHIFLDMLTMAGIPTVIGRCISSIVPFINIRNIRLVPKSHTFATDTPYESYVRKFLNVTAMGLLIVIIIEELGYLPLILSYLP